MIIKTLIIEDINGQLNIVKDIEEDIPCMNERNDYMILNEIRNIDIDDLHANFYRVLSFIGNRFLSLSSGKTVHPNKTTYLCRFNKTRAELGGSNNVNTIFDIIEQSDPSYFYLTSEINKFICETLTGQKLENRPERIEIPF